MGGGRRIEDTAKEGRIEQIEKRYGWRETDRGYC